MSQINDDLITAYSDFCICNDLIYLIDYDKWEQLVMLKTLKKVFKISYNLLNHQRFHQIFDKLTISMYFNWNAAKQFQKNIEHCLTCQLNQTKRHKSYRELNIIYSVFVSFNTIAMNFVITLSEIIYHDETVNTLLNVTDKYLKWILIISDKNTHTVKNWALTLLEDL